MPYILVSEDPTFPADRGLEGYLRIAQCSNSKGSYDVYLRL